MRTTKKILSMILAFVMVLGLLPATVFATGAEGEDVVFLSISFDSYYIDDKNGNPIAKVDAAEVGGAPFRRYIIICGSKGTIKIDPIEFPVGNGYDSTKTKETYLGVGGWVEKTFGAYGRYNRMLSEFAAMVRGEKKNPYTYESEKELHKLISMACEYED